MIRVPPPRLRRSSTASATMAVSTASVPSTITICLRTVGAVMNRVSMSTRAESPGPAGTLRSVKIPPTWGFFSAGRVPAAPGMPTNSAPAAPASAQACSTLQAPAATAGRCATAATVSRKATTTTSLLARTNSPFLPASMPPGGSVETTRPPSAGRVATAGQGMEMSSARGAPDTRGAVIWLTCPSTVPCGHSTVAVVWRTGSSGTARHSSRPAMPATAATDRGIRCDRCLPSWGTRLDRKRRGFVRPGCGAARGRSPPRAGANPGVIHSEHPPANSAFAACVRSKWTAEEADSAWRTQVWGSVSWVRCR